MIRFQSSPRHHMPPRHHISITTAAAALAALAALTACGSGGSASSASASAAAAASPGTTAAYPTGNVLSSLRTDPKLRAQLPASARGSGTLTLGTTLLPGTSGLPHAGETPGGQLIGLDVDLRDAIARLLGISWSVQNGTFDTIIPGTQNGRFDVGMDNFGVTRVREKVVSFATYLTDGQSLLGRGDGSLSKVTSITDLCGLTLATSPGTTFQEILTRDAGKCSAAGKAPYTVQYFADPAAIWLGLENGKVDVYFGPTLSLRYDATHVPNTRFLGQFSSTPVGFVTAKGSPLTAVLSAAVNELIADGTYAKILAKWGVTSSGIAHSQVNPPAPF